MRTRILRLVWLVFAALIGANLLGDAFANDKLIEIEFTAPVALKHIHAGISSSGELHLIVAKGVEDAEDGKLKLKHSLGLFMDGEALHGPITFDTSILSMETPVKRGKFNAGEKDLNDRRMHEDVTAVKAVQVQGKLHLEITKREKSGKNRIIRLPKDRGIPVSPTVGAIRIGTTFKADLVRRKDIKFTKGNRTDPANTKSTKKTTDSGKDRGKSAKGN